MDRHGIRRAMLGIDDGKEGTREALRDEVWPQFLRDNAVRVIKL